MAPPMEKIPPKRQKVPSIGSIKSKMRKTVTPVFGLPGLFVKGAFCKLKPSSPIPKLMETITYDEVVTRSSLYKEKLNVCHLVPCTKPYTVRKKKGQT